MQFWSRDRIQIFTIDLVLDLLNGQHFILFFSPEIDLVK